MKHFFRFLILLSIFTITKSSAASLQTVGIDTLKKGKGYYLLSKTNHIQNIFVSKKGKSNQEVIQLKLGYSKDAPKSNVISSGNMIGDVSRDAPKLPIFDKIDILKGSYKNIKVEQGSTSKSLSVISDIQFPLRLRLTTGAEILDIEFLEAGEWNVDIDLKK